MNLKINDKLYYISDENLILNYSNYIRDDVVILDDLDNNIRLKTLESIFEHIYSNIINTGRNEINTSDEDDIIMFDMEVNKFESKKARLLEKGKIDKAIELEEKILISAISLYNILKKTYKK